MGLKKHNQDNIHKRVINGAAIDLPLLGSETEKAKVKARLMKPDGFNDGTTEGRDPPLRGYEHTLSGCPRLSGGFQGPSPMAISGWELSRHRNRAPIPKHAVQT